MIGITFSCKAETLFKRNRQEVMVKKISTLEPTWKRTTTSNLYVVRYTGSFDAERSITCCQSFLSFGFNTFFF